MLHERSGQCTEDLPEANSSLHRLKADTTESRRRLSTCFLLLVLQVPLRQINEGLDLHAVKGFPSK
jgi:hypothetical protein